MIDTHLHILPGVDNGPKTIEDALALAKALVQEGVHTAIATPHYNDLFPQRSALEIKERINELQQVLNRQRISRRLFSSLEALIKPGLVEDIQAGRLARLNDSRYLLLELWNNTRLPETERVIFELRAFGIVPIIAHPERYRTIQQEVLAQLTANSPIGMQGNTVRHTTAILLKKGLIHCIAFDAHGLHKRPPAVARSLRRATALLTQEQIYQMVEVQPAAIINHEICSLPPSSGDKSFREAER